MRADSCAFQCSTLWICPEMTCEKNTCVTSNSPFRILSQCQKYSEEGGFVCCFFFLTMTSLLR